MIKNTVFIFDFDGVIVDSVTALYDVYIEFLNDFGINGCQEEFNLLNGPKLSEIITYLKKTHHIAKNENELLNDYLNKMSAIYKNIKLSNGIEDILKKLQQKNFKIALASSSKRKAIEFVLHKNNLSHFFDFIATGDDVDEAKPSPEIYNLVKKNYPEHEFYVIEDSENGVKSAVSAGIKTVWYNPTKKGCNNEATYEFHSLSQIKNIITEINLNCFTIAKSKKITLKTVTHKYHLNAEQEKHIDEIWHSEFKSQTLFNGKILSYLSHKISNNSLHIECFITQYKYFFAQIQNPKLQLNISPIGVSGIILDPQLNTLLAIRNKTSEYQQTYELVPSGSIEPEGSPEHNIDFLNALIKEFHEETKLPKKCIKQVEPFCFVYDKNHNVYDICSKIHIKEHLKESLFKDQNAKKNEEYKNIERINLAHINKKIAGRNCVPTSIVLLHNIN